VFLILSPFAKKAAIGIFGRDLLQDRKLKPLLQELIGKSRFKPFECVGTVTESRVALLLQKQNDHPMLHVWDSHNALPKSFARLLRSFIDSKQGTI
jgi:hypothetical protein